MSYGVKTIRRFSTVALALMVFLGGFWVLLGHFSAPVSAVAGTNEQINFQGRLFNGQGAVVPDGFYNIEFKIYQDGAGTSAGNPGGTLEWTESRLNNNSQGVQVKNGYMSADLGSVNPFGSQVDWNQSVLWLSMNIGSTNPTCTPFASCTPDGEMLPMKRLSSSVYSMNTGKLGGLTSGQFVQLAQGVQTDASTASSIFINKTGGSGNLLQLQASGADVFNLTNAGDIQLGSGANHTLSIATSPASTVGRNLTMSAGTGGSGAGSAGGMLTMQGGNAGGTNANGGDVTINGGAKTGSGTDGAISIGTSSTSTITLGQSTTLAAGKSLRITGDTTANRPASPTEGMIFYDTTTKQLLTYANGKWQADRTEAAIVAASNSSQAVKDRADYVADGTGDQVEINTALTAAAGGRVYLAEGTYNVSAAISIPNSTTLSGAGNGSKITVPNSQNGSYNIIENTDASTGTGVNIRDLMIDGNKANQSAGSMFGINLTGMGGGTAPLGTTREAGNISGVTVSKMRGGTGIVFNSSRGIRVANSNLILNTTYGIRANSSSNIVVSNNDFQGNSISATGAGVTLVSTNNSTITGNTFDSNGTLSIGNSGTNNTIASNTITGSSYGVVLGSGSQYVTVTGNTIQSPTLLGIWLDGTLNSTVTGNNISGSGGSTDNNGIQLDASDSNIVTANTITDSSATTTNYAINISSSTSDNNYFSDNTLGGGSINNLGTGTQYGGQLNASTVYVIQAAGGINLQNSTNVTGSLTASTSLLAPLVDTASAATLNIGGANATAINVGNAGTTASVRIGNSTGAVAQTINVGTNATAGSSTTLNLGSAIGTSTTSIEAGTGGLTIGTANLSNTIQIGSSSLSSGTQAINIGTNNTAGGTTNVTIGSGGSATGGTTNLQAKTSIGISTNGIVRATIDNADNIYFGNGVTAAAPNNFAIRGTGSSTTAVAGGALTVQGGNATVGNANGGNVTVSGGTGFGTGVNGLVVLTTPTFQTTANDANCYTGGALVASSCTMAVSSVNNSAAVIVGFSAAAQTASMPDPTVTTAGRIVYVTAANGSSEFTLSVNGGGTGNQIAMRQNTTATMIWNGSDWTAAGASSSTTLQAAYDNTLTSAGGAELLLSNGSNANGLTIRDSSTNPVNGTLLEVQNSSAANLFSVNSNVNEYASNAGAEAAGGTSTTFPSSTWSALTGGTVTRYITAGNNIATGQASVSTVTTGTANAGVKNQLSGALSANTTYNISFTTRLSSGIFTDMNVYYSVDGTAASISCTTTATAATSVWSKVNCTFTTPASGITSSNAIFIRQTAGTARTFYVDNLSVTIAADYNFATDGDVNDNTNFATNWLTAGLGTVAVTRNTGDGYNASDSAQAAISTSTANAGLRNKLGSNPLPSTLYRITVYGKLASGTFTDFKVRYSRDGSTTAGGNYVDCVDYNTQTLTTSGWTKVTCYITTDATTATNPHIYFAQTAAATRTFMVDAFSMTLRTATTPNVQIGGGVNGGPTTLLTLDKGASAPIASDNDALLGSMYYDTTLGKLQCYEADGWGACGSSPDNVVTISPEYTNAVLHGTGVGTMTSDLCSDTLNINDGSSGQPTICGTNETYNFYKWTSPQASAQTYGIYVTYQLPSTFKEFASGQTSLMGRTDSANSTVNYQIYRSDATGLTACGSAVTVSTGVQTTWQTVAATGAADPSTCSFNPGDSVVFKINTTASNTANAYVGNLNFIFSNR